MKIKGNWAFYVAAFYIFFVICLVAFVFWTTFHNEELVDKNYYDLELKYQEQIDRVERTHNLKEQIKFVSTNNVIMLSFPKIDNFNNMNGSIHFFRPSNSKLDFKSKFQLDSSYTLVYSTDKMERGLWKIKVNWFISDSSYYNEETVLLN